MCVFNFIVSANNFGASCEDTQSLGINDSCGLYYGKRMMCCKEDMSDENQNLVCQNPLVVRPEQYATSSNVLNVNIDINQGICVYLSSKYHYISEQSFVHIRFLHHPRNM